MQKLIKPKNNLNYLLQNNQNDNNYNQLNHLYDKK